jgi:hypothetical protein
VAAALIQMCVSDPFRTRRRLSANPSQ